MASNIGVDLGKKGKDYSVKIPVYKGRVIRQTPYKDMEGNPIFEGDILVGKADMLHPMSEDSWAGGFERDFVKQNYNPSVPEWIWNGAFLKSSAQNTRKVGSIFDTPELLLYGY